MLLENSTAPFDRRVRQEAFALRDASYRVVVISPRGDDYDRERYEVFEGIEIYRYPLRMAAGGAVGYLREYSSALWSTSALMRRLSSKRSFDVVHVCNPPDFLVPLAWSLKRRGARLVFDHHDLAPELYESRFGHRDIFYLALLRLEVLAFRLADVVITTNESYRRIALGRGKKQPGDVFVVRNAPDPDRFRPVAPDESMKKGREFLIAYVGLMGPQDGIDAALRSLALLRRERDDWHAVFMGDGDVLPEMRRLAAQLDVADVVDFTGRVDDARILPVLSAADVCISPEPSNPLNDRSTMVKVMEYMAMGRPVVAFDLPETRVSAAEAALYAPPGDELTFARCIARLLEDRHLRAVLGDRGRDRVQTEIGWHHSKRELLRAYAAVLRT
jgi:glycosyltransferase involved in cell wall biosynthesis